MGQLIADAPVAVVTGATSGIGFAAACGLARAGFRLVAMGRDPARISRKADELAKAVPASVVAWVEADFLSMRAVTDAASKIADVTGNIDVLVNNAGVHLDRQILTPDGFEATFAVNHLAPFLLTHELLPLLQRSDQPHVITVSSVGHTMIEGMCWDDPHMAQDFDAFRAYCQSKLANVLFTRELARRFGSDGLIASAVHPGLVASRFPLTAPPATLAYYTAAEASGEALTSEQGADTIVWLACNPGAAFPSGGYFVERQRCDPAIAAQNDADAARLWLLSERAVMAAGAAGAGETDETSV